MAVVDVAWDGEGEPWELAVLALGLLAVTLRYGSLWLGGAMLFYAAQFTLHSVYLVAGRSNKEIAARLKKWKAPKPRYTRGVLAKYAATVSSASEGAVTDKA